MKRCVFLGNLAFDSSDETIYNFFEQCGEISYVRLIRDSKTNIGKGFGYVQFKERSSVDLALKLTGTKIGGNIEGNGREVRVTRCDKGLSSYKGKVAGNNPAHSGAQARKNATTRLKRKSVATSSGGSAKKRSKKQ